MMSRRSALRGAPGFTLIEMLLAMALMGVMMVGVLPLFTKAMSNNVEGSQLTEVTNRARLHLEELMAMPVDGEDLTVPDGDNELLISHVWSVSEERWIEGTTLPGGEEPAFSRVTRVRQFNMSAINNIDLEFEEDERLVGGAPSGQVHIKEIVVRVNSGRPTLLNLLGRSKSVTLRVLKSV